MWGVYPINISISDQVFSLSYFSSIFFHPQTELISQQMRTLVESERGGAAAMLQHDQYGPLGAMYRLLGRVDGGLDLLRRSMGDAARSAGRALVLDPERTKDPVEFVLKLLEVGGGGCVFFIISIPFVSPLWCCLSFWRAGKWRVLLASLFSFLLLLP
jgi:hypothetical protein